jgi:two-component system OmpR family sensor kinase
MPCSEATTYFRDLYEIGIDASLSLEEKIEQAVRLGTERLDTPYGVLSYTGGGEYEIIDSTFADGAYVAGTVHDLETTWCRHVVSDQQVLAISDAGESSFADDIAREVTDLQCYIGAPILVDGESYGTLCYSGEEPRNAPFTEDEKRFVRLLSRWIGYEIERQKHYQALDRQNERLNEFAGVLTHDLRNPLTSARGYTELVSEMVSDPEAGYLQTVLDSLDRMETLITETLALARDGGDVGEREPVDLATVAKAAWDTVNPANARLEIDTDRELLADKSRLRQLFENLFRNVDEHCGSDVTVTVRNTDDGFVVADDGPGLPPSVADTLFDSDSELGQVGLGLLIIERIVSGHGWHGQVTVNGGTTFTFTGLGRVPNPIDGADVHESPESVS